ncbi:5580_t:CDS:2 [Acaulospora morrowiae]|uniref:E2 ubiquitin-conjugating enzyme n=1 Tax=Acaulospora morrowiae TaxID=94023 RepID=A0A9N8VMD0_9GLOM|nr:5580_t:CDS:2 [Acaulospora morrowiae]
MSSSQLLPRMKRELEILERDAPPGIVCYPVDDSFVRFCAQIKGPKDTPYEEGMFKVDVQIPTRYPMEPPKMQFVTPIYHPNIDDVGRICLDILKMPPNELHESTQGSWKPSLNISTTLTSLSLLMAEPNPDDPLLVEIASEYKENRSLFLHKARESTLKHAVDDKKAHNAKDVIEDSSSSPPTDILSSEMHAKSTIQDEHIADADNEKTLTCAPTIADCNSRSIPEPCRAQTRNKKALIHRCAKEVKKSMAEPVNLEHTEKRKPFGDLTNQNKNSRVNRSSETKKSLSEIIKRQASERRPLSDLSNRSANVSVNQAPEIKSQAIRKVQIEKRKHAGDSDSSQQTFDIANATKKSPEANGKSQTISKTEKKRNLLRMKPKDGSTAKKIKK